MSSFLFILLIIFYEIYNFTLIPDFFHWKLAVKVFVLFLCFIFSLNNLNIKLIQKCSSVLLIVFLYLLFVILSSAYAVSQFYVFSQGLMLVALILFTFKMADYLYYSGSTKIIGAASIIYMTAILLSLFGYFFMPNSLSNIESGALRLHGLYSEPGQLGIACGLNLGLVYFTVKSRILKSVFIMLTFICLLLTGFRTAAVSVLLATLCLIFLSATIQINVKVFLATCLLFMIGLSYVYNLTLVDPANRYFRIESFKHLSGRTALWKKAIPRAIKKPLGNGFCLGGTIIAEKPTNNSRWLRRTEKFQLFAHSPGYKTSLHSGYVQALSDIGPIGFIFYFSIFVAGFLFIIKARSNKNLAVFSYVVIFLSFANFAESIIMSPTYTSSLLFWLSWFILMINSKENTVAFNNEFQSFLSTS